LRLTLMIGPATGWSARCLMLKESFDDVAESGNVSPHITICQRQKVLERISSYTQALSRCQRRCSRLTRGV
jgi:hypothetical protein